MARWRLQTAHYLMTDPPTEYVYTEVSRETGKAYKQTNIVPLLLEPKDPADHNYPGDIIVSDGHNKQPRDIVFKGEPTPEMEPIDDEAKAISQKFHDSGKWKKPAEGVDYGEGLIRQFMAEMVKFKAEEKPTPTVNPDAFDALQKQVSALVEQNKKLMEQLAKKVA